VEPGPPHGRSRPSRRAPARRARLLLAGLRNSATWLEIGYGILWTLILGYFIGMLTPTPPWTAVFWQTQGLRLVIGVAGSLLLLGAGYLGWELYHFASRDTISDGVYGADQKIAQRRIPLRPVPRESCRKPTGQDISPMAASSGTSQPLRAPA